MTEFDTSNWAKPEFSQGYRDSADVFIVERRRMLAILRSIHVHFVSDGCPKAVLDLGCGNGIITSTIAQCDSSISPTLTDGSTDMLAKAKERLNGLLDAKYIHVSFQEMLSRKILDRPFDFIVSSLAIHHLTGDEKMSLFRLIHALLKPGGRFVNIDVILAPHDPLEQWYLSLWKDWIDERKKVLGISDGKLNSIIRQYKDAEENRPDTLHDQLDALCDIGFHDVDCYYKYGIFTMFGGRKGPGSA